LRGWLDCAGGAAFGGSKRLEILVHAGKPPLASALVGVYQSRIARAMFRI
jgi:hypothetical protein